MSDIAIQMQKVTKAFGSNKAVDSANLIVPTGSVFGFLGPNGAGKTTAIRMIMGHLHATEGAVKTLGTDPWQHDETTKRRVAYVSENMALPGWMRPEAAVEFGESLYPNWDGALAKSLLDEFALRGKGQFSTLSKGQKRALCIVLALCQTADLMVIDEPAAGLDTVARRNLLDRILDVACEDGRTVFLSSHILSDLERVVDRVAILCEGRLILEGELDALKQSTRKLQLPCAVAADVIGNAFEVLRHESEAGETEAVVRGFDEECYRRLCAELGCPDGARHHGLNLEDLFVEVARAHTTNRGGA